MPDRGNACGRHYGPQPQAKIILDSILKMLGGMTLTVYGSVQGEPQVLSDGRYYKPLCLLPPVDIDKSYSLFTPLFVLGGGGYSKKILNNKKY